VERFPGRLADWAGSELPEMGKVNASKGTVTIDERGALMWCEAMKT